MASNPLSVVESVVFLAVMLFIVKVVIDALEAAPVLDFETQADDAIEDAWDSTNDLWGES